MQMPSELQRAIDTLLSEVLEGPPGREAFLLNGGDRGLLGSLDALSAADASHVGPTGSSIAAHVDHVRYGFGLMNRWFQGENPFGSADWKASWERNTVTDADWAALRHGLREEAMRWKAAIAAPRDVSPLELTGIISSIAHTAYHFGAMRQIQPLLRGPLA